MRRFLALSVLCSFLVCCLATTTAFAEPRQMESNHPAYNMLGEKLSYDISFLWFKRLAEGTVSLSPGPEPGQYVALLEARTLGLAAFLTQSRVERIETVMEIAPSGLFRPVIQRAHTIKGDGDSKNERVRSYRFDYEKREVYYKNRRTGKKVHERAYPMDKEGPVYDLLSAFYNVRAGLFGSVKTGLHLALPTFTRRGTEDITVVRIDGKEKKRQKFFPKDTILCKVLVDPDIFKTKGRKIYVGLNDEMVPQRMIVKKVIGIGDVRGVLRSAQNVLKKQSSGEIENAEGK